MTEKNEGVGNQIEEERRKMLADGLQIVEIWLNPNTHEALRKELQKTSNEPIGMVQSYLGLPIIIRHDVPDGKVFVIGERVVEGGDCSENR